MSMDTPRGGTRPPLQEPACFRNSRANSFHKLAEDADRPACMVGNQSPPGKWRVAEHRGELPLGAGPCKRCFGDPDPPSSPGPTCPLCREPVASVGIDTHLSDCPARE